MIVGESTQDVARGCRQGQCLCHRFVEVGLVKSDTLMILGAHVKKVIDGRPRGRDGYLRCDTCIDSAVSATGLVRRQPHQCTTQRRIHDGANCERRVPVGCDAHITAVQRQGSGGGRVIERNGDWPFGDVGPNHPVLGQGCAHAKESPYGTVGVVGACHEDSPMSCDVPRRQGWKPIEHSAPGIVSPEYDLDGGDLEGGDVAAPDQRTQ